MSEALRVTFVLDRADLASVAVLTEALTRLDELARARRGSYLPPLYNSGVRYEAEPFGVEEFPTTPILYQRQRGDCAPLAAARASELRAEGYPLAVAFPVEAPGGVCYDRICPREIHILVTRDGTLDTIEDPSAILGMRPVPPATLRELARASRDLMPPRCGAWR